MKTLYLLSESPASLLVRLDFPPIQQDVKCDLSCNLSVSLSWGLPGRGPHDSCQVSPSLKLCARAPPAHKEAVSPGCHHQPSTFSLSKEVWSWGPLRDSGQCVVHSLPPPAVGGHSRSQPKEGASRKASSLFAVSSGVWGTQTLWKGARWLELAEKERAEFPARGIPSQGRVRGLVFQARQGPDRRSQSGVDLEGFCPGRPPEGPIWPQGGMDISFRVRKE